MSERTADIIITNGGSASGKIDFSKLTKSEKQARIAEVMERGLVGERMRVDLPEGYHGEWVHNSPEEIYRMQTLGYIIDDKFATRRALHSEGDGKSIVGDTVFMICDAETKQLIDAHRQEQFERLHGKPGAKRTLGEEREFAGSVTSSTPLGVINESQANNVTLGDIAQSVGVNS